MQRIQVIDSHTAGEPTRVVIGGFPDLGGASVADQLKVFRTHHDQLRSAIVNEPRGSDVLVGALLVPPADSTCVAGVLFFNNVGFLHMCGHGMIGVARTLAHMNRIKPGTHRIETPVGVVSVTLHDDLSVSIENVPSFRFKKAVRLEVPSFGPVTGDIAWGGNWFFLVHDHNLELSLQNIPRLTDLTQRIRVALPANGITGENGGEIDHIELFGRPTLASADSKNFVLCPGLAYDRSPCGTGTSAKLACLAADGKLAENESFVQESILGTTFTGRFKWIDRPRGIISPIITGQAYVTGETTLLLEETDPFRFGIH